jgi:glutamate/tyrosine decarboxylase-like PLP-dependent enzyme
MALHSGYFNRKDDDVPNPGTKSAPSTRPLSALPLVTALKGRGLDGVVVDLRAHLHAIRELDAVLRAERHPTLPIRPVHRPDTGILCFELDLPGLDPAQGDALHRAIYARILAEGTRTISVTVLDGRTVLRLLTVSAHIRVADFLETIAAVRRVAAMCLQNH